MMKRNHVRMAASVLVAVVTILGTLSSVLAQSAPTPVRNCVVRYLRTPSPTMCASLDAFHQEIAAFDECQSAPAEPLAGHFCGVCVTTTGRVPSGCERYMVAPWSPPVAPQPTPVVVAAMDAAVITDAAVTVMDTVHLDASNILVVQEIHIDAGNIESGFGVVIAALPNGAQGSVILTPELLCRTQGGYWDATAHFTMEHGRIQHGYCLTVEMQAYARAQAGMSENIPPDQILAGIRRARFVQEARLQEVTADVARQESQHRLELALELNRNQAQMQQQIGELHDRDRERQRHLDNFRRNFGLDLQIYGGGSVLGTGGRAAPAFMGLGTDFVLPIASRFAAVLGAGIGGAFPLEPNGAASYQFFERVGVRYYHPWVRYMEDRRERRREIGLQSYGFGTGVAAYQLVHSRDFHLQAQTIGAYLEGFTSFAFGPMRFRVGLMLLLGPGARETTSGQTSPLLDFAIIGSLGPEFRF